MALILAGCGSGSTSGAKAGPITIASPGGIQAQPSALSIGSKLTLSMTPSNDPIHAGVDWAVTCGGNPTTGSTTQGACGTFSPVHTPSGASTVFTAPSVTPIGTTVTITATVTSNPSQTSNLNLIVLATPITISLSPVTTSMEISTTTNPIASVTNDPLKAGVIWTATCGAAACGSFNPPVSPSTPASTTYTAPSVVPPGDTVTLTATSQTDTTKSVSSTITITGPPPPPPAPQPISISVAPAKVYVQTVGANRSANLAALVSNDVAAAGVDWTLSCSTSNCGIINSHTPSGSPAIFNNSSSVPAGGIITITAKSTSDPTKSASASATVVTSAPIVVAMSSTATLPATMNSGSQTTLSAKATPDIGGAGINWTANCGSSGACGTFNLTPAHTASNGQIVYTAPATVPDGNVVTIIASSAASTPSNPAIATTRIVASPPPPPSLAFTQAPPNMLVSAAQAPVSVAIANDVAPGGVTWTVQCSNTVPGGCGWLTPTQTASGVTAIYTAPPVTSTGTTVTLTATSIADSTVSISGSIAINPDTTLKVSFVPSLPSQMQTDATVNLNAAAANDVTHGGVDWKVCASGCGFFTIKPATPEILATSTTAYVPPVPAVTATSVSAWANGLPIPYTAPSQSPSSGSVAVVVSAHADTTKANSGTITISPLPGSPVLNGFVQAGTQPVVGSSVSLYAAGTVGYGSLATLVASAPVTDLSGGFTVPAGSTCPRPDSQMYLVAKGGKVGTNNANPNLALMTALGSCSNLGSSPVVVNEVTTIASAIATAPFAADDALTGNSSYLYLSSSSGNLVGLANAFASVNNLADVSTGKARFTVPAENATVPYVEINTMADLLNACSATAGGTEGDGSSCSTLFTFTDLLGTGTYASSIAPADTLQAAFNIAQHPAGNYGYLLDGNDPNHQFFALATSASPFQPILTAQPNDWSVSLNYTSGGGLSGASSVGSLAIDATGNLWITDTKNPSVIEWNTIGAALSPSTGFPTGGGPIATDATGDGPVAIDATGNVWISSDGSLVELTNLGTPLPWSPYGGVADGGNDAEFDAQSNLWITDSVGVHEFNNLGLQLSPINGYTVEGISNFNSVGIDSSNNVWIGTPIDKEGTGHILELTNPGGQPITSGGPGSSGSQMAADSAGNMWFVGEGLNGVCEAPPYGGKGSTLLPNCSPLGGINGGGTSGLNIVNARGVALDGAGTVWVASQGGTGIIIGTILPPGLLPFHPGSSAVTSAKPYLSSSLAAGPLRVAVDSSGNVWVLLANNTVTEYVGAAAPVVTPLALGTQKNKLAARP